MMINMTFKDGEIQYVDGSNTTTLLVDRSETVLTEICRSCWQPDQLGPSQKHKHRDHTRAYGAMGERK
jgi:hypothetical protein